MPDYKTMYFKMFNKVSNVIEELQTIQQETERMYVESDDEDYETKVQPPGAAEAKSPPAL